jgi:hypothetical protein
MKGKMEQEFCSSSSGRGDPLLLTTCWLTWSHLPRPGLVLGYLAWTGPCMARLTHVLRKNVNEIY